MLVTNKTKKVKISSTSIERFNSLWPRVIFVFKFGTILNLFIAPSNNKIDTSKIFPNNTFPSSKDNIFYDDYLKKVHSKLIKNNIQNIYIVESFPNEFDFLNIKEFVGKNCFKKKELNQILIKIIF